MRENENLEEIFDRYAGLELLNRDWPHSPGANATPDWSMGFARAAAGEFSPELRGEPLPRGVAGST